MRDKREHLRRSTLVDPAMVVGFQRPRYVGKAALSP
jgi:hypothetical protein